MASSGDPQVAAIAAILTAAHYGDHDSAVRIWRDLNSADQEDVLFGIAGVWYAEANQAAELMGVDAEDFIAFQLQALGRWGANPTAPDRPDTKA